jgi:glycosyltransferase involved in cell wall biosynthesis
MTISILLPYKENYTRDLAGAVSLFVKDISEISKFKKEILIFGSTENKKFLTKNYINLNLEKKFFQSSNREYVKTFLKSDYISSTKILEIHNRPNYIKQIRDAYQNKIFLYFHNDPLTMNGSRTILEREFLLNNIDKIIFNSKWSQKRFFFKLDNYKSLKNKTSVCYQSTSKTPINFKKKKKIISFIGKLNTAKGFDLFGNTILKVLNKHKDWKAYVIGDEPREKMFFEHKNFINLGFKDNPFILNFLKKVSISIVCSRWNEPFGRASLEASSRGAAVIISNKGGLPETSSSAIILKTLNETSLYKTISNLIKNKKVLLKSQKDNHKNFYLTHKFVSKIIDDLREKYFVNSFYFNSKKILKIMHITNFNYRFDGRLHYNTGRRINNGFVRLGHNVLTVSDRDILNQRKKISDPMGFSSLQNAVLTNYNNFKPDLVILGHADSVSGESIKYFKDNGSKVSQWFLDPVSKFGPDYYNNKRRILIKSNLVDATFLTTDPKSIDFDIKNSHYIPNPCDYSFETLHNYNTKCENDVFFAMSHGVHRGGLKTGKIDDREVFIKQLIKKNKSISFDIYGMNNSQPIWAENFLQKVSNSSMGLNLSRGKPIRYYSSDRIAQLVGNGLLTFIDERTFLNDLFSDKEIIFYKNLDDLSYKINKYKKDETSRKKIAKNGKKFYFKYFNSSLVAEFIIKKTLDIKSSKKFLWEK